MNTRLLRSEHQRRVDAFMRLAGQRVPDAPTDLTEEERILRAKLILEEVLETIRDGLGVNLTILVRYMTPDAKGQVVWNDHVAEVTKDTVNFEVVRPFDLIETIDGCCDLSVVTVGTLSAAGIPDTPFLRAVDRNNLEKFGEGHQIREDGKLIKPPGHKPPDIAGLLAEIMKAV